MSYSSVYSTPLGHMLMWSHDGGESLSLLCFYDTDDVERLRKKHNSDIPLFADVRRWLDIYFSGSNPPFTPPISLDGTDFQKPVWEQVMKIPYGQIVTYSEIASRLSRRKATACTARSVAGALAHNPILLIVPCHRVIGKNGSLTGYAGGLDRKEALLTLERKSALKED